jgi:hypothetical protein
MQKSVLTHSSKEPAHASPCALRSSHWCVPKLQNASAVHASLASPHEPDVRLATQV